MKSQAHYLHPQKVYAERYGITTRTIRTYMKQGLPLDDPERMREHLASNKGRPSLSVSTPAKITQTAKNGSERLPESFFEGRGLDAASKALTQLESVTRRRVAEALDADADPKTIQNRMKEHLDVFDALTKAERDLPEILLARKSVIPVAEVQSGMNRCWRLTVERLKSVPLRAMQTCVGMDAIDIREEIEKEIEEALSALREDLEKWDADASSGEEGQ